MGVGASARLPLSLLSRCPSCSSCSTRSCPARFGHALAVLCWCGGGGLVVLLPSSACPFLVLLLLLPCLRCCVWCWPCGRADATAVGCGGGWSTTTWCATSTKSCACASLVSSLPPLLATSTVRPFTHMIMSPIPSLGIHSRLLHDLLSLRMRHLHYEDRTRTGGEEEGTEDVQLGIREEEVRVKGVGVMLGVWGVGWVVWWRWWGWGGEVWGRRRREEDGLPPQSGRTPRLAVGPLPACSVFARG